ncbi:hypothetical protein [Herbaspirillum chlorophenolicum]
MAAARCILLRHIAAAGLNTGIEPDAIGARLI